MRRKAKLALAQVAVTCLVVLLAAAVVYGGTLQEEFDRLCVHTQEAESLSLEKLQELLKECDQLQKSIEESSEEKKKLLLFRLKKCRNFFSYIIGQHEQFAITISPHLRKRETRLEVYDGQGIHLLALPCSERRGCMRGQICLAGRSR